jgi:Rhodopirellula transposase DDE domain
MSPLRWTTRSTRYLAGELTAQGREVSADTVGDLLRAEGFSLQGSAKTLEGQRHPDRDAQFRYINEQVKAHQDTAGPVISVDTKKKELQVAVAALFGVRPETVNKRIRDIRQLLDQAGHTIQPGQHRLANLANLDDLYQLAKSTDIAIPPEIKTAC